MARLTKDDTTEAVERWLDAADHPHLDAITELRGIILGVDDAIAEGIKWKAPSFRTEEYFATVHLRTKTGIGLILHLGAKKRSDPGLAIEDPESLLQWLADDRAMIAFADAADLAAHRAALESILRQWIRAV